MREYITERAKPRDILFFLIGCVIAYHEVFVSKEAQPLLMFTVLFLWGLIPAFWGDRTPAPPKGPDQPAPPPANPLGQQPPASGSGSNIVECLAC
jgi:hypothetical protein